MTILDMTRVFVDLKRPSSVTLLLSEVRQVLVPVAMATRFLLRLSDVKQIVVHLSIAVVIVIDRTASHNSKPHHQC